MLSADTTAYTIQLAQFEGPLDLLLHLIEHAELDITTIALAQVADQYLQYIRAMPNPDAGQMSAFIVMASRLLVIKSRVLLPTPPRSSDEPDESIDLVAQLKIYQHIKQAAEWLRQREQLGWQGFGRVASFPDAGITQLPLQMTLDELILVWQQRMRLVDVPAPIITLAARKILTVGDVVTTIHARLQQMARVSFFDLLPKKSRTRVDVVVSLWAVLEMIKRRAVVAHQDELFGPIHIEANRDET
ncbi:MAG: segregation/condensation protein A [Chloroflexales bacterium]|nr:segregation/condensation protein A [Chloroflexales bacterium]